LKLTKKTPRAPLRELFALRMSVNFVADLNHIFAKKENDLKFTLFQVCQS